MSPLTTPIKTHDRRYRGRRSREPATGGPLRPLSGRALVLRKRRPREHGNARAGDRRRTRRRPGSFLFSRGATEKDRERVCVRLTPRALHELYIEAKDLSPDARQAGHTAECDPCGESVPLEKPSRTREANPYIASITSTPTAACSTTPTSRLTGPVSSSPGGPGLRTAPPRL